MKNNSAKHDVERWFEGEISAGRLIHNSSLETCYAEADDLIGGMWQVVHDKAYDLDRRLSEKIAQADAFRKLSEQGDTERTAHSDAQYQKTRALAFQEARVLLRMCLLGCIDKTGGAAGE